MQIDQQTAGGRQQNDEDYNFPTGVYLCKLKDVTEMAAKQDDESKTPRLVFEFEVVGGEYSGKKLSTFVRKNLFAGNARGAKPSHLFKLAKSLGVIDPMAGFDTNQFIGKYYTVVAKNEKGDRAWPDSIIPASTPGAAAAAPAKAPPPRKSAAPVPVAEPADDSKWELYDEAVGDYVPKTGKEVRAFLNEKNIQAADAHVCPEGSDAIKPASEYGFVTLPF